MSASWSWIWPPVGGTPISEGLDSEMFDRDDYPYTETFVREAIQNSLDARMDEKQPVLIRFDFHQDHLGKQRPFLEQAVGHRRHAGLPVPDAWKAGRITWMTVEDSNTKGLLGGLDDRTSDFWGYWLNFGRSNKSGRGRGGRGIGRVTFLIASRMHTVMGMTRRHGEHDVVACGMAVLKAGQFGAEFKSTHAYLADRESGPIYSLHSAPEFCRQMQESFELAPTVEVPQRTGLSLIIPYPFEALSEDGVLAASVDHFAPAILDGSLVVEVGSRRLDEYTIRDVAPAVSAAIKSRAISAGVDRYLDLISRGLGNSDVTIELGSANVPLSGERETSEAAGLRSELAAGRVVAFSLVFPLHRNGAANLVRLTIVAAPTPHGMRSIDRLFREGMSLPEVRTKRPTDLDLVVLIDQEILAQYLNFCEGKAHLDLHESQEVKEKLAGAGFDGLDVKRLVKALPDQIREFLTDDGVDPDSSVWEEFFAVPDSETCRAEAPSRWKDKVGVSPEPPGPLPPANPSAAVVDMFKDGFRLKATPGYTRFPATVVVSIAYADGSANPAWSEHDFTPADLVMNYVECSPEFVGNCLRVRDWNAGSCVEVTGFDTRRELDTRTRTERNASQD